MTPPVPASFRELPRYLLAILFIVLILAATLWIMEPFLPALIWSTLIVVSTWQVLLLLQRLLWGRRSLAVAVMASVLLLLVIVPLAVAVMTIADNAHDVAGRITAVVQAGVPAPPAWLERIPVAGARLAAKWRSFAALTPEQLGDSLAPYVAGATGWFLLKAGGLAAFLLHLVLTVIIAVLLYAHGETAAAGVRAFALRLGGVRGVQSVTLAGQAIRAVALGVLVTALVQAVLGGIGLAVAGVPFAGALTALMFVLAVAQIGATPVLLLALGWLYWSGNTWVATAFLPWAVFVGVLDNILRPLLIKRGADLPLILIFAGVIGGLLAFGIVGLFVGPVVLAVAYTQLSAWMSDGLLQQQPAVLAVPQDVPSYPGINAPST